MDKEATSTLNPGRAQLTPKLKFWNTNTNEILPVAVGLHDEKEIFSNVMHVLASQHVVAVLVHETSFSYEPAEDNEREVEITLQVRRKANSLCCEDFVELEPDVNDTALDRLTIICRNVIIIEIRTRCVLFFKNAQHLGMLMLISCQETAAKDNLVF